VPERPAQGFGFGLGEGAGEAEVLEPAHECIGEADDGEPGGVRRVGGEWEPLAAGVLESF
jgi:hypothetical protein